MDQDFAKSIAAGAKQQGQDAVNSFSPSQTQKNFLADYNNLTASQGVGSRDYQNEFAQTVANNPSVTQLYNEGNEKFGIPQLTQQATYLNNQVNRAVPDAYARGRGFNMDDNQARQAADVSLRFNQPAANAAQANLNAAQGLAQGYVQAGQAQNAQNLLPIQSQAQFLLQQQGQQGEAYMSANTAEMQGLIQKMQSGVQLSQAEYDRYNQLVQAQASIQSAQTAANAEIEKQRLANQYQIVPQNNNLVNTFAKTLTNPSLANPNGLRSLQ